MRTMSPPVKAETVTFHLEKTHQFQTLQADGMVGGLTPSGQAFLAFYVERAPLPQKLVRQVNENGTLGDLIESDGKKGIFRELHTGLTFNKKCLEALKMNIDQLLKQMEDAAT